MPETVTAFFNEFEPKFRAANFRWNALYSLAQELIQLSRPILVVETGTTRALDNWLGDGQATLIWDWLIERLGGEGFSVDIDLKAVELMRRHCRKMKIVCEDSLLFLRNFERAREIDLLYLDSYDFDGPLSPLHMVAELACIYDRLKPGCFIAVDDCREPELGKHVLIKRFFKLAGVRPLAESYITVWRKP